MNKPMITESSLSRTTIDALLDPLLARADQESAKSPTTVEVPPGFQWSDTARAEIERVEAEHNRWSEANTALIEAVDSHREAVDQDQAAVRAAIKADKRDHPGTPKTDKARLAVEFALMRCELARKDASRAAQGPLANLLKADASKTQAREAVERVEANSLALIAHMKENLAQLNHDRWIAFRMAQFAAQPNVTLGDRSASVTVRFPTQYEVKMTGLLEALDRA